MKLLRIVVCSFIGAAFAALITLASEEAHCFRLVGIVAISVVISQFLNDMCEAWRKGMQPTQEPLR